MNSIPVKITFPDLGLKVRTTGVYEIQYQVVDGEEQARYIVTTDWEPVNEFLQP